MSLREPLYFLDTRSHPWAKDAIGFKAEDGDTVNLN